MLNNQQNNTLGVGDTWPPYMAILCDQNGPVDLTTATSIKIEMQGNTFASAQVSGAATATVIPGQIQYAWGPNDTAIADTYQVRVQITFADGYIVSFPDYGFGFVQVT